MTAYETLLQGAKTRTFTTQRDAAEYLQAQGFKWPKAQKAAQRWWTETHQAPAPTPTPTPTPAPAPAPAPASSPHFRYAIDLYPDFSNIAQTASRNAYIIVTDARKDAKDKIKAANPNCKVLLYKDLTGMTPWLNSGVQLVGSPENFYLHTLAGQRFTSANFSAMYMANPADPGYQAKWAQNVVTQAVNDGWDGVFMDDTNPSISYHHPVGDVKEMPSDTDYSVGVGSLLAYVTLNLRTEGKIVVGNIGAATDSRYQTTVHSWLDYRLDGAMWEWWQGNPADQALAAYAQSKGRFILARQASGDALNGFKALMSVAPNSYYAFQTDYTHEPLWLPEFGG